jgi:predicted esterase
MTCSTQGITAACCLPIIGFSNGGMIALQVAIRHPQVVRTLVIASGFFSRDGADAAFWNGFAMVTLDMMPKVC